MEEAVYEKRYSLPYCSIKGEVKYLSSAPLERRLLALPANIRLRMERLAMDKRCSLFRTFVNYRHKVLNH